LVSVWLILRFEAAMLCFIVTSCTCRQMYINYRRVTKRFGFDESETVDFRDIMEGPAAIIAMPSKLRHMTRRALIKAAAAMKGSKNNQSDLGWYDNDGYSSNLDESETDVEYQQLQAKVDMKRRSGSSTNGSRKVEPIQTV
jgi:hypothetical protein